MPTLDYLTGFNHLVGTFPSDGGVGPLGSIFGAVLIDTTNVRRAGGTSLKVNPSATLTDWFKDLGSTANVIVVVAYVYFTVLPGANIDIITTNATSAANAGIGYISSSTQFCIFTESNFGSVVYGTAFGPTVSTSTWYRLEFRVDMSNNPWLVDAQVATADGSATSASQVTPAFTADHIQYLVIGNNHISGTMTAYYTDIATSSQSDDYPIGPIQVLGYSPASVGTHNLDASTSAYFFSETAAPPGGTTTALTTSETTSYQSVDDFPLDGGTDAVKVTPASGSPNTPTFRSAGAWSFTSNNVSASGSLTPGAPSGKAVGDLLLLVVESRGIGVTVTTPSGWNLMTNFPKASGTASGGKIFLYTRVADGTATDTPSVSYANATSGTSGDATGAGILAFTNLTETQDQTAVSQDLSAQGSTSSITGITTQTNHSMVINVAMKLNETSGQTASVTTYTEAADNSTTSGTGHIVEVSYLDKATAGASGSGTITWSGTTSARAFITTVALKSTASLTQPLTTWYTEYGFGSIASQPAVSVNPYAVRAIVAQELDTAVASTWAAKLYDGNNAEDISNSSISTTTRTYVGKTFISKPVFYTGDSSQTASGHVGDAAARTSVAQSFNDQSGYLSKVDVLLAKTGSPTDALQLTLQTNNVGVPSGTILATANTISGTLLSTTPTVFTFYFVSPFKVISGTTYWLVLSRSGAVDLTNYYFFPPGSDTYSGGTEAILNTGVWSVNSTVDIPFGLGYTWTLSEFNTTRIRFGYTAAASGHPRLASTMLEAAFPIRSFMFDTRRVQRNNLLRR